jgi:hypothetical protein
MWGRGGGPEKEKREQRWEIMEWEVMSSEKRN